MAEFAKILRGKVALGRVVGQTSVTAGRYIAVTEAQAEAIADILDRGERIEERAREFVAAWQAGERHGDFLPALIAALDARPCG